MQLAGPLKQTWVVGSSAHNIEKGVSDLLKLAKAKFEPPAGVKGAAATARQKAQHGAWPQSHLHQTTSIVSYHCHHITIRSISLSVHTCSNTMSEGSKWRLPQSQLQYTTTVSCHHCQYTTVTSSQPGLYHCQYTPAAKICQ